MFVAVDGEVVGTGFVECWGFPVPGVVALWAFYFEDCGAEVCEPHGAVGSGENSGEVCDGEPSRMFMVSIQPQLFADSNIKLVIFYDFFVLISIHGC